VTEGQNAAIAIVPLIAARRGESHERRDARKKTSEPGTAASTKSRCFHAASLDWRDNLETFLRMHFRLKSARALP
jgi:hypothetical protein